MLSENNLNRIFYYYYHSISIFNETVLLISQYSLKFINCHNPVQCVVLVAKELKSEGLDSVGLFFRGGQSNVLPDSPPPSPLCTALHFLRPVVVNSKLSQRKTRYLLILTRIRNDSNTLFMNINCISGFIVFQASLYFKLQNETLLGFIRKDRSLCFSQNRTGPDFDFDRILNSNQIFLGNNNN